jgi:signal transduction histidine kinase
MAPSNRVASFDAALVEQAILNLIKNAADAVEHTADPLVRLVGLQDADALHIEVHDNGVGIEDDLLEEIFVPFFTTKPDGAGIGLALARQVALAHGGGLTACRAYPAGTVFKLRLPVQS